MYSERKPELDFDLMKDKENEEFNEWVKEELRINSKFHFKNRDFNKLSGFKMCVVFGLDLKESKRELMTWLLEESYINSKIYLKKDLLQKLPRNVNKEKKLELARKSMI